MPTGNRVIVVNAHSAGKYAGIVKGLLFKYDEVVVSARGRHFARLAEVLKLVRSFTDVKDVRIEYADEAPELFVTLVSKEEG